jgi:tetratricopeptide (TPR) repeat protein
MANPVTHSLSPRLSPPNHPPEHHGSRRRPQPARHRVAWQRSRWRIELTTESDIAVTEGYTYDDRFWSRLAAVTGRKQADEAGVPGNGESWPVRSGAVPPLAEGFTARPDTGPALAAALAPGTTVVLAPGRAAAAGPADWLAPCGKTQLAVSFAESLWRSREVDLLVWVTATSRAAVLAGYLAAAVAALGADPAGGAGTLAARLTGWLGRTSRSWLVVLDDLSCAADLAGLMPAGPAGRVLITTRDPATVPGEHEPVVLPVGAFSPGEALTCLMGRLGTDPGQHPGAKDLAAELGGEPLALAQASAVIGSSHLSCRDYHDSFMLRRKEAAAGGPAASVTWLLSAELADRLAPAGDAPAMLALVALLDGHGIPAEVLAAPAARAYLAGDGTGQPAPPERAQAALAAAQQAGLLATRPLGSAAVRLSPAVQAAIRAVTPEEMLRRAAGAAADALVEAWPEDDQPPWLAEALRSCVTSLRRTTGDALWVGACPLALFRAGRSLDSAGLTGPAVAYWRDLAAVSNRVLGRGHPDTLAAGDHLAEAYLAAGQADEAVSCCESVLAERIRVLGPDHPSAIMARRNLGRALMAADKFADAIAALDRVAADYERARGADHGDTLGAKEELAAAYLAAGRAGDAIGLYQNTLAERERVEDPESPAVMTTRQRLAGAYLADGKVKTAMAEYKRVLADRERALGPDDLDTIDSSGALGAAYYAAGRMASALQLYERAREGHQRVLGADHPDALASSARLAYAYQAVSRVTDATALLRDTLARCERALPPGDPLTAAVRERLAALTGE